MRNEAVIDILRTNGGKFFSCQYTKKDGSTRRINGRLGVTKHLVSHSALYDDRVLQRAKRNLGIVTVWDAQVENDDGTRGGYRTLRVERIGDLRMRGGVVRL